jgi:hypothetical protein
LKNYGYREDVENVAIIEENNKALFSMQENSKHLQV